MRQLKISKQITNRDTQSLNKYFAEINSIKMISAEEEVELTKRIRQGDRSASEALIKANLRFVVSVAKQYQTTGALLDDLISAGNIGLIEASQRFDETKGFKFISYAVWWIRQSISQYLSENNRSIRIPLNKISSLNKLTSLNVELEQILERKPSLDEISDEFNNRFDTRITPKAAYDLMYCSAAPKSIDAKLSNNDDSATLHELIEGGGLKELNKSLDYSDLKFAIKSSMNRLSNTERNVLLWSFGIDCQEITLNEIGENLMLSKERVRQIREKAIRRLRNYGSKKLLKEYV